MRHGPDAWSRDIGALTTLALHLVLAAGLLALGREAALTTLDPVQGRAVLHLRVNQAPAGPPPQAAVPEPEPEPQPQPEPAPVPAPKPEPIPEPRPEPQPEPKPEQQAGPTVQTEEFSRAEAAVQADTDETAESSVQAGTPEAPDRDADLVQRVLAVLRQRIEAVKHYPFAARKAGITGTVRIMVEIDVAARVVAYRLSDPDQSSIRLNRGAEQTMAQLLGVRLAEVSLPSSLLVEVPIVYELR